MEAAVAIKITDLHKFYGKFEALKGVSLAVPQGNIFGLLGANGAGKSTMIKILVGSSLASQGTVSVLGFDPIRQKNQLRSQIGYMPQVPAIYEDLSASANVKFFGAAHRLPNLHERVESVLEFVGLHERRNDPIYSFSGGMKQRVSLACALVHQPKILFLDEPTAGIDPLLRKLFWQHFRNLAEQGHTIFITTHLMDEAFLCDRLAIMREGVVLVEDTPINILRQGHSDIKVTAAGIDHAYTVKNYPAELPKILQEYGLSASVSSIELTEDNLETVMLDFLNQPPTQVEKAHKA